MYYYRMAEFMLTDDRPEKDLMYHKMVDMFEKCTPSVAKHQIPYKKGYLPCLSIGSRSSEKTLLIHGGYDSFIQEFYFIFFCIHCIYSLLWNNGLFFEEKRKVLTIKHLT